MNNMKPNMKVLIGCITIDSLGGSQVYHYELVKGLHNAGIEVTLCTFKSTDTNGEIAVRLRELGIPHINWSELNSNEQYDLIVASQPEPNEYLLKLYNDTPIISIIHSEVRDENPILNDRISHYIAIRQPIADLLTNHYNISQEKVSLIYNPIDKSRYKPIELSKKNKTQGIFVGEVLDYIRYPAVCHLVEKCIQNDWELFLMSESKYDFNHPNIKYVERRWNTEEVVKSMDFTAGILLGRTTLEGICCGIPGYVYIIDTQGNIQDIQIVHPGELENLCDSDFVISKHIELYNKIIQNGKQ